MAKRAQLFDGPGLKADLSPMIDLVFLLLIFFMVAANIITFPKDPNIVIPVASDAKVPELVEGRIVLNIYIDGAIKDIKGTSLTTEEVTQRVAAAKAKNPNTRLHLRAHKDVPYRHIQTVSRASAVGGVPTIIFSTYQVSN
ncbi:biopolymer transporter ExbD [Verrucomicrobiales bacterium]|nr:biopolymer transporter ExbD [Verrucomicrobiales bacterium]MDA7926923.1 biopolymer transporter ExbD [Verrucomicrobiales bacterium]MDB4358734.1 biopolymer transporter ExbD [Verrucomicrobiales bacterium]